MLNGSSLSVVISFLLPTTLSRNNLMGLALSYQAFLSGLKVRLLMVAALKLGKRGYTG
jgi:hypothetical protein